MISAGDEKMGGELVVNDCNVSMLRKAPLRR